MFDFLHKIKGFILKAVIFVLLFCVIDAVSGVLIDHFYFQQNRKLTYALEQCDEDILLFGSSRTQHHFNTKIIADNSGVSVYNLGSGGQNIFYHYAILKSILARQTPQIIVLHIETIDIYITPATWDKEKLSVFYPYCKRNEQVHEIINLRSNYEPYKLFSNLYRYNSVLASIAMLKIFYNDTEVAFQNGGYVSIPEENLYKGTFSAVENEFVQEIDPLKIEYINKFISLCKTNNIECVLVISPWFADFSTNRDFVDTVRELSLSYSIPFLNYINDEEFMKADYFKDQKHLNGKGADIFSRKFVSDIKNFISVTHHK